MTPQGRGNKLTASRGARPAGFREKTTRKKRLADRARTFRKSELDVKKNTRCPARGEVCAETAGGSFRTTGVVSILLVLLFVMEQRHRTNERAKVRATNIRPRVKRIKPSSVLGNSTEYRAGVRCSAAPRGSSCVRCDFSPFVPDPKKQTEAAAGMKGDSTHAERSTR